MAFDSVRAACASPNLTLAIAVAASFVFWSVPAEAAPPQIVPGSVNIFRDFRGANDVGLTAGDRIQYGAEIAGGSAAVSIGATAATGFVSGAAPCSPLAVNANFCANATGFNSNRLDPWQISFTNGDGTTTITSPSLVGVTRVPFPTSVTLSGTGLTPTISWQIPTGFAPDGLRINIDDKASLRANGAADVIFSTAVSNTATSFQLPSNIGLNSTGSYAINFQVVETRNHVAFTNNNAQIFSRSSSFFDFSPLTGNVPSDVALPTIDSSGVYNFSVGSVGADHVTFIDPAVATGYSFAIGASGPNFQSLLLPDVGDGIFTVTYTDSTGAHTMTLLHDQQFFFGSGGVSSFKVTGIETSAMLDPANATAFITGLTFASAGSFTGTMTPITTFIAAVPEPRTWTLLFAGLCAVGWATRRTRRV